MKQLHVILLLVLINNIRADNLVPPNDERYFSSDKTLQLQILPPKFVNKHSYRYLATENFLELLTLEKDPQNIRLHPEAFVERINSKKKSVLVWRRPLLNRVAPAEALISNNGEVVTFDDWSQVGHGENVVVVYSGAGKLIKRFALHDLIDHSQIKKLPRTESSIIWRKSAQIREDQRLVLINIGNDSFSKEIKINLSNGGIVQVNK